MDFRTFYENFKEEYVYLKDEKEKLPGPLTCEKANTMENDTIIRRIPETILKRVREENSEYGQNKNIEESLEKLNNLLINSDKCTYEMLECNIDNKFWNFLLSDFIKREIKILNNTWLFNEYYFYRYLNCVYDFEKTNYDFFFYEKKKSIIHNKDLIEEICKCSKNLIEMYNNNPNDQVKIFSIFFFFSLWSNQFDLSWNASKNQNEENQNNENDIKKKSLKQKKFSFDTKNIDHLYNSFYLENILDNDISRVYKDMVSKKNKRFDIVLDNMGIELICDLCFLYFIYQYFDEIYIHTKKFPLFVSDNMTKDIKYTLDILSSDEQYPNSVFMAKNWKQLIDSNKWKVQDNVYWNLPLPYWIMPKTLLEEMKESSFVCFKGDANYRRCLGDLHFDFSKPSKDVLNYFPFSVIALRCLKSPVCCGIDKSIVDEMNKKSTDWSNYGEYAILQYCSHDDK
ncbi:conserved protein, unknown function [Plasmodium chabaudi adami]|uniref:Sugar phosphate phosphatase n=1 Tax=Plasmodium chabaudi adami TaxID=5826 RepID=A0A1C6XAR6_PLACE|nr:conserved protein, unknown function [Plasmodium chabaudi adami]